MNEIFTRISDILKPHLQQNITLTINNKKIKTGKFILYTFTDYHIELTIIINNKTKKSIIPIPFEIEHYKEENLIYFDYRIKTLLPTFKPLKSESKYYNKILEIEFK